VISTENPNFEIASIIDNLMVETFEKCSFLFKSKERENFNRMNTLSILWIKI